MPAPELTVQTPGYPLANAISTTTSIDNPDAGAQAPVVPDFTAKHNGGGRWIVIDANAPQVDGKDVKIGDFTGTKDEALAEVDRLSAGGEPLVLDPQRINEAKPSTPTTTSIDPATIKQPVLTDEGWLCPVPPVKG